MKTKILNKEGKQGKEIELPSVFSSRIREDISQRYFEIEKKIQPYGPNILAGKLHSASGKIRHARRMWKTAYGRGISRVPRKIFWRRGTQFHWVGASVVSTVGGRAGHPPKTGKFMKKKKINKKEALIAISSALSSTANINYVKKRYETLDKEINLPIIIESDLLKLKTKEFFEAIKRILNNAYSVAIKYKKKRAGKGKLRGRKYKINAGMLLVIGNKEDKKIKGIDIVKVKDIIIRYIYPLGRLTVYTEKAVEDLRNKFERTGEGK